MKLLKKTIYKIYKTMNNSRIVTTVAGLIHIKLLGQFKKSSLEMLNNTTDTLGKVKIAFICDEMTWQNFNTECEAIFVTPKKWKKILTRLSPDILFCESAWSGIENYKHCWRGQIYKNEKYLFRNRKTLFKILKYCKQKQIPTVFWNKEDPLYFNCPEYNFSDTALHFDYILTTAQECVDRYKELGHENVHTFMFGYSPRLFYMPTKDKRENIAMFAGSWYGDQVERCHDVEKIFDKIIEEKIELQIYDRQSESGNINNIFPDKYKQYIKDKVSYDQLGDIYRNVRYAVNINTVKDSNTMFARRVFEAMACGCIIISNDSEGLKNIFQDRIWFVENDFNHENETEIMLANQKYVLDNHSYDKKFKSMLEMLDLEYL